jgi:hypothetical protein
VRAAAALRGGLTAPGRRRVTAPVGGGMAAPALAGTAGLLAGTAGLLAGTAGLLAGAPA